MALRKFAGTNCLESWFNVAGFLGDGWNASGALTCANGLAVKLAWLSAHVDSCDGENVEAVCAMVDEKGFTGSL